jgi:hypothetical protein
VSRNFGNREKFAIEYTLSDDISDMPGVYDDSWGKFWLWVEDKNLCEYSFDSKVYTYQACLWQIVEWFCNNLACVLGYDEYPLPVNGNNTMEMDNAACNAEFEDEIEETLWTDARYGWVHRHFWLSCDNYSFPLSCVGFVRHAQTVEVMWDNCYEGGEGPMFTYEKGVYFMPYFEFKKTIFDFLHGILEDLEKRCGRNKEIREWQKQIWSVEQKGDRPE